MTDGTLARSSKMMSSWEKANQPLRTAQEIQFLKRTLDYTVIDFV